MMQSRVAQRNASESGRLSNDRYFYAVAIRACLTLVLIMALAGGLFVPKRGLHTGPQPSALSFEQTKPKTLEDTQIRESLTAGTQPATHAFYQIETKPEARKQIFYAHNRAHGFGLDFSAEYATYPLTIDPVWTRVARLTPAASDPNEPVSFSIETVGGAQLKDNSNVAAVAVAGAPQLKRFANWDDVFAPEGPTNYRSSNSPSTAFVAAVPFAPPPNITVSGSCDTFGNSQFTIKNIGGAMTTNYTWELYQNNVFLTNGTFMLTASGTSDDTQQLTINGLYGTLSTVIKNGTTSAATPIANASAFCVERPTAFVRAASGQTDPTTSSPIRFAVTFSKAVTGFANTDVTITGMAARPDITVTDSGDHKNYTVAVAGMADGETVTAVIPQDAAIDADGNGNRVSTYLITDHSVTYHAPPNLTLSGTCDLFANSAFTIENIGGAMTTSYTWEIYQNNVFLTNGTFSLTKAGTSGDTQSLTINGLYGNITVAVRNGTTPAAVEILRTSAFCVDSSPTVTINQASTQSDPTNASPINFAVVFNTPVSGFINTDVHITGMAGTAVKTVTDSGDHMHFNVAVTGMADGETVTASLFAGAAFYLGHSDIFSKASTSTDNHVTYDISRPTVTVNQASGQSDPTDVSPIHFDVVFSEPITGFASTDLDIAGVHGTPGVTLTDSGDHKHFSVAVTGMINNDRVTARLLSGKVSDAAGNLNLSSTSTDGSVTFADTTPPTVTVEQKSGQADPVNTGPIHFTATFSEPIDIATLSSGDITVGGTAGATTAFLTEIAPNDHTTFDISVSGMTGDGTVTASIAASRVRDVNGNLNTASTSTDNTVTYDATRPTVTIDQASGQNDPADNSPINFQVVFSEPVTDFHHATDVSISGTAGAHIISITGGPTIYNVAVSGMTSDGTVIVDIPPNAAKDAAQNLNIASTSTDNTVTFKFCAANPIVTSNADSGPNTLRDALANICAAPNNNITFDLGGPGGNTIVLTSGQLDIQKDVNITNIVSATNGPLTIDGNNAGRVFLNESGVNTSIAGLTITNGNHSNLPNPGGTGSGIRNDGTLVLSNVVVTGNQLVAQGEGGGIYNDGTLTITDSTISNNVGAGGSLGAGIANNGGSVSMTNCTVSGNTGADQGGGIRNSGGTFGIVDSTITANAAIDGAAVFDDASGTLNVTNSTISRNAAGGNGGGFSNSAGTLNLRNSIVALNTATSAGPDISGVATSQGFNLIGNNADATLTPTTGDQIGTAGSPIDPLLGVLGNYGGPTQTLRLLTGSTAIDQGDSSGSPFDQRGLPRSVDQMGIANAGDGADIGAYEMALAPEITPGGPTTFCAGDSVTLTSSSPSGNQWFLNGSPIIGETNQTYVATTSGNYTVEAENVTSTIITVTVNPFPATPIITPAGPTTFCAGGSVTLGSSSASGNQWFLDGNVIGGATSQTYVANASGNYTVVATTSGCASAASAPTTITVNPIPATPTITPQGPTTFCDDDNVTLSSSSATGNQWYLNGNPIGGATAQDYVAVASGNYTVVVTANGCDSAASAPTSVTVNSTPLAPTITPGGLTTFCVGGQVTLNSNYANGNQWYLNGNPIGGATSPTYVATASGDYTDTVTSASCTSASSAPISVTASPIPPTPTITPGGATTFCDGGSVTLASSSANGNQWFLNGNPIESAHDQTYIATASGNYTVTVTESGCTTSASGPISVTVNPIPPAPSVTPGGPTTFCDGGSVTLTSNSASGNQWYLDGNPIAGATNQTYIAKATGNYTDKVTALSCTSAASIPISVTVNPIPPAPSVTPSGPTTFCDGDNVMLTSSSASGNQWYLDGNPIAGATNQTYIVKTTGNYTDKVTTLSCTSAASTPISVTVNPVPPAPSVTPSGPTTFCDGGSVTLTSNSASGNQWYLDGNPIAGATNQTYIAKAPGNYTDKVTTLSCTSPGSTPISVTVNPIPPAPTITAGGPTTFCDGGTVTLTSSSASGNQWYLDGNRIVGATNQTYIANASGAYTDIVTQSDCPSPASTAMTISVKPSALTVSNTNDSGAGSLRQAIADICEGGTIDFNLGAGAHTIVLNSELDVSTGVNIINAFSITNGPVAISGNNAGRVFNLNVANPGVVTLSGLSIANGNSGAGNGGGILNNNTGTLNILNSTLSGNAANTGGAIYNSSAGVINITNSTVSVNNAQLGGGGVANAQRGAINFTNSTLSHNSTNGQGGGILNSGSTPVSLRNSIVGVNTAAASGPDLSGAFASMGHNLIGQNDASTGFTAGTGNVNGDLIGTSATPINPRLGPLQNNGGATQTRSLLAGSPALDAGDNCVTEVTHCGDSTIGQLSTDQRGPGFSRILDAAAGDNTPRIDIGAFEVGPSVEEITDKTTPEDTPLTFIFKVGDGATAFDSITATSANATLVPNANLTIGPDTASTRSLSITPAPDQTGSSAITVTITKTINGTLQSMSDTFVLTVTPVNDRPTNSVPGPQTVIENSSLTFSAANLNQISISDIDAGTNSVAVTLTATNGTLSLNGTAGLVFTPTAPGNDGIADSVLSFEGTIADINTAMNGMEFTPTPGYQGPANLQIQTSDKGFTGSGGPQVDNDTVNITVLDGGAIGFSAANFTVNEAAGTATITVNRTGGSRGEARVNYATSNGTALAGAGNDYLSASGQLIFPDGVTSRTFTITVNNDLFNEPAETVNLTLTSASGSGTLGTPNTAVLTIIDDDPAGGYIKFSSANYTVAEGGGAATITVERLGSLTQAVTVDYATSDDGNSDIVIPCVPTPGNTIASSRCDFDTRVGRLSFAAGDGSPKTFSVMINQDSYLEGPESLQLALFNLTGGAAFASPSTAILTITDDDLSAPTSNIIDDSADFVRQHYHDFLNREPDPAGLAFWTNQITACGNDAQCVETKRINVSAAFFLSIEFQATGGTAYLTNKVAFGSLPGFMRFESDTQALSNNYVFGQAGAENILEANKMAYFNDYVSRPEFSNTYNGVSDQTYVNTLISNTGVSFTQVERDALLNGLANHTETRATVLRKVSEKPSFAQAEFNRMFVLMEYFGYLRRDPDTAGFNFWLNKLDQFNGNYLNAEMTKAFITSAEYRRRFGPSQ